MKSGFARTLVATVLAGIVLAATSMAAQAASYSCTFEAKRTNGAVIPGTRGEGRSEWSANANYDQIQSARSRACAEANRRCTALLGRVQQQYPGQYRNADCKMSAELVDGRPPRPTSYACVSEGRRGHGQGQAISGTRGEGRTNWTFDTPADRIQGLKRQACAESDRQCSAQLDRMKRQNPDAYRNADCVVTAELVNGRVVQTQPPRPPVQEWVLLGEKSVNNSYDRDTIEVHGQAGPFRRIRLQVLYHDIEMRDLTVFYGNGERQSWQINRRLRNQDPPLDFDLRGDVRNITRIEMGYRTSSSSANASVRVFALR